MNTKRLELFLLAGCSCLITLLAQPIASAIASPPIVPNLQAPKPVSGAFCALKSEPEFLKVDRSNS
ncbi:MAG: hypothetical protein KME10_00545 [Plectolyngbya sp. WJT66-NPBG17]|nr:hypothetical protein [Plectolyngbya sp. WJT66-NPBG17]MBW4523668.1 hypothetical protein [Phormidium tanganyikae FI6-MK23]